MKALAVVLYSLCNASYGMIAKILRVSNVAVYKWIKAEASRLPELNTQSAKGIIQIDELWHFVNGKKTRFGSGEPMILLQGEL